jgi:hypothetical protein
MRLLMRSPSLSNSPRIRSAQKTPILRHHLFDQRHGFGGYLWFGRCCSGCVFPEEPISLTMPAQERLWLNDEKCLLPGPNHSCEKHQKYAIRFGTDGSFDLSAEDDQRLSKECVFCHEIGLRSCKVSHGSYYERGASRFRPVDEAVVERL